MQIQFFCGNGTEDIPELAGKAYLAKGSKGEIHFIDPRARRNNTDNIVYPVRSTIDHILQSHSVTMRLNGFIIPKPEAFQLTNITQFLKENARDATTFVAHYGGLFIPGRDAHFVGRIIDLSQEGINLFGWHQKRTPEDAPLVLESSWIGLVACHLNMSEGKLQLVPGNDFGYHPRIQCAGGELCLPFSALRKYAVQIKDTAIKDQIYPVNMRLIIDGKSILFPVGDFDFRVASFVRDKKEFHYNGRKGDMHVAFVAEQYVPLLNRSRPPRTLIVLSSNGAALYRDGEVGLRLQQTLDLVA